MTSSSKLLETDLGPQELKEACIRKISRICKKKAEHQLYEFRFCHSGKWVPIHKSALEIEPSDETGYPIFTLHRDDKAIEKMKAFKHLTFKAVYHSYYFSLRPEYQNQDGLKMFHLELQQALEGPAAAPTPPRAPFPTPSATTDNKSVESAVSDKKIEIAIANLSAQALLRAPVNMTAGATTPVTDLDASKNFKN